MAETRIQGAVSVIGEIQFRHADTLVETSGYDACLQHHRRGCAICGAFCCPLIEHVSMPIAFCFNSVLGAS